MIFYVSSMEMDHQCNLKLATRLVGTTAVLVVRLIAHVLMTWPTAFMHIVPH